LAERLERDKGKLERWRKSRRKGERIPQRYWERALSYVGELPLHRISREFRLDYNKLKQLSGQRSDAPAGLSQGPSEPAQPQFLDLTAWLSGPAAPAGGRAGPTTTLRLERPDGSRLSIEGALPEAGYVQALVSAFYG
jgi:hypothetical protein